MSLENPPQLPEMYDYILKSGKILSEEIRSEVAEAMRENAVDFSNFENLLLLQILQKVILRRLKT